MRYEKETHWVTHLQTPVDLMVTMLFFVVVFDSVSFKFFFLLTPSLSTVVDGA